ncbi:MAG: hypothetical protein WCN98_20985, partial [Verrucomicrobiaceae bacterium]
MKHQEYNHPDLTAFVLGELDPAASARMRRMIDSSPEIRAECARMEQVVTALKRGTSIPRRTLNARQRETVLAMSQR